MSEQGDRMSHIEHCVCPINHEGEPTLDPRCTFPHESVTAARWWPGRTDEVRRVADRLRGLGQPDGHTTNGELAARTGTGVAIVLDAIAMNDAVLDALDDHAGSGWV